MEIGNKRKFKKIRIDIDHTLYRETNYKKISNTSNNKKKKIIK